MKKNCLYITFNGIADPLGQSQVLPYLEDLSKNGIRFRLISFEKDFKKAKFLNKKIKELDITWYKLKYLYSFGLIVNTINCFFLSLYLLIFKDIKIVHCRSYMPMFSVFWLKRIFDFRLIFDMRGFWPEELADSGRIKYNSIYYKILKFLERKSILASDYIITLTPEAKEIILEKYPNKKVDWMPTCVDMKKFEIKQGQKEDKTDEFILVYSGSLGTYYNMPAMMDFFEALKEKISNAHFLILANNGMEKLDKEQCQFLNLEAKEVPKYLSQADLAISFIYDFPSKKAAFPTKLAEYLASGLPVVANAQSKFIKDLIEQNKIGVIIEKFDKCSYDVAIEKLLILLQDKDIKERCIQTAKKNLGKGVCVNKYLEIYKNI